MELRPRSHWITALLKDSWNINGECMILVSGLPLGRTPILGGLEDCPTQQIIWGLNYISTLLLYKEMTIYIGKIM